MMLRSVRMMTGEWSWWAFWEWEGHKTGYIGKEGRSSGKLRGREHKRVFE